MAILAEPAGVQLQPRLQAVGQPLAMRDDDEDHGLGLLQFEEQLPDLLGRGAIEVAGRLVGQEQIGGIDQRPGQGGPLPLAAGEFRRAMLAAIGQADALSSISARWIDSAATGPNGTAGSSTFSSTEHCGRR